ncbi:hypothetical protein CKA32_002140 [Geitlerinema sp. FC II]|nr:hypothetical protein CKA32_002140 [Geitlerinema sp. FC II]
MGGGQLFEHCDVVRTLGVAGLRSRSSIHRFGERDTRSRRLGATPDRDDNTKKSKDRTVEEG